jgi:UDP-N-acetylmuramoyl-tripeptide--D-alanyl-D-alanine ligase
MAAGFTNLAARDVGRGRRVLVLSDMLELGDQSRALHQGLAAAIDAAGLDVVHAAGPEMRAMYEALRPERRGVWAATAAELAEQVETLVQPGDLVMVKGSNGSRASLVAAALADLERRLDLSEG